MWLIIFNSTASTPNLWVGYWLFAVLDFKQNIGPKFKIYVLTLHIKTTEF